MKKFLILFGLLLPLWVNAQQIDSFSVAGRTFRFEIPKDWILQEKSDNIQNDSNWNAIMHYAIDTKDLNARIGIKIEKRIEYTETKDKKRSRKYVTYGDVFAPNEKGYFAHLVYPNSQCKQCLKEYTDIFLFYLTDELNIRFIFAGKGKEKLMDSLSQYLANFKDQFFAYNKKSVSSFRMLMKSNDKTDSIYVITDNYKFRYDSVWQCNLQNQSQCRLTLTYQTPESKTLMIYVDMLVDPPTSTAKPKDLSTNKKATNSLRTKPDTNFWAPKPVIATSINVDDANLARSSFYCPSLITYSVYSSNIESIGYHFEFSLCIGETIVDPLLRNYYQQILESYISDFLAINNLNWKVAYNRRITSNTPPELVPKSNTKTKVD